MNLERQKTRSPSYRQSVVLILLLAYGLRIWDITARSLWFDEAVEYLSASVPFNQLPQSVIVSNYQPPLFTFLLHSWIQISIAPIWLRYLPVILSMLTAAGMIAWAKLISGRQLALLAGGIIAVMPTEIYYAQDVGEYALLVCMVTFALLFLDRARRYTHWRDWLLWGFFSMAAVYSHYGAAIIIVPASFLVLLNSLIRFDKRALQKQIIVGAAAGVTAVPLFTYFLPTQIKRVSGSFLAQTLSFSRQEMGQFTRSVGDTFLYNLIGWPHSDIHRWIGLVVLLLAALLALSTWRKLPGYLLGWFVGTYLVYYILVRLGAYAGFGFRYGLIFTPLLVIGLIIAIGSLMAAKPRLSLAFLGLVLGIQIYASPHPTLSAWLRHAPSWSPTEALEPPFAYWQIHRNADDATFVYYNALPAFRYYLRVNGLDPARVNPPSWYIECSAQEVIAVCRDNHLFYSPWMRQLSAAEKGQRINDILGGFPERLWLVFSHTVPEEEESVLAQLSGQYVISDSYKTRGASVYLLVQ